MLIITVGLLCGLVVCTLADPQTDSEQCLIYIRTKVPGAATPVQNFKIIGRPDNIKGTMEECGENIVLLHRLQAADGRSKPSIELDLKTKDGTIPYHCEWKTLDLVNLKAIGNKEEPVLLMLFNFQPKLLDGLIGYVKVPVFVAQEGQQINRILDKYLRSQKKPDGKHQTKHTLDWLQNGPIQMRLHYREVTPRSSIVIAPSQWSDYYANCQYVSKDALQHVFEQFGWAETSTTGWFGHFFKR